MKQKFNHAKDCDCPIVNPITEWAGGSNLIITGYKCPKCGEETPMVEHQHGMNSINYINNVGERIT